MSACKRSPAHIMMNKIRRIHDFFDYPKRSDFLIKNIREIMADNLPTRSHLIDCCKTRWVARIDALQIFYELYLCVRNTLLRINLNQDGLAWNDTTVTDANIYLLAISDLEFIFTLTVVSKLLDYTRPLTVNLQEKDMDIASAFKAVKLLQDTFASIRSDIEKYHDGWYKEASEKAENVGVKPTKAEPMLSLTV